jgi:hypothetical protein
LETGARLEPGDLFDDLLGGLLGHGSPTPIAMQLADAGVENAQVVVDLGDRAYRGARIVPGRFLIDRDGRRETADGVIERFVHLTQELAGIARERLHVASLPLRIEGVESGS